MNIDRLTANNAASTYQVQNSAATGTQAASATGKVHKGYHAQNGQGSDSVTLSDNARSLANARAAVLSAPDVRTQQVADIKQRVSDGTYSVPASLLARKMIDASA